MNFCSLHDLSRWVVAKFPWILHYVNLARFVVEIMFMTLFGVVMVSSIFFMAWSIEVLWYFIKPDGETDEDILPPDLLAQMGYHVPQLEHPPNYNPPPHPVIPGPMPVPIDHMPGHGNPNLVFEDIFHQDPPPPIDPEEAYNEDDFAVMAHDLPPQDPWPVPPPDPDNRPFWAPGPRTPSPGWVGNQHVIAPELHFPPGEGPVPNDPQPAPEADDPHQGHEPDNPEEVPIPADQHQGPEPVDPQPVPVPNGPHQAQNGEA